MRNVWVQLTSIAGAAVAVFVTPAERAEEFPATGPAPTRQVATQPAPDPPRGQFDKAT